MSDVAFPIIAVVSIIVCSTLHFLLRLTGAASRSSPQLKLKYSNLAEYTLKMQHTGPFTNKSPAGRLATDWRPDSTGITQPLQCILYRGAICGLLVVWNNSVSSILSWLRSVTSLCCVERLPGVTADRVPGALQLAADSLHAGLVPPAAPAAAVWLLQGGGKPWRGSPRVTRHCCPLPHHINMEPGPALTTASPRPARPHSLPHSTPGFCFTQGSVCHHSLLAGSASVAPPGAGLVRGFTMQQYWAAGLGCHLPGRATARDCSPPLTCLHQPVSHCTLLTISQPVQPPLQVHRSRFDWNEYFIRKSCQIYW